MFREGITEMVAVTGVVPVFIAVNPGTFPVPPDNRPIEVLELVHANVLPSGVLLKFDGGTVPLLQTLMLAGTKAMGTVLIMMYAVSLTAGQLPEAAMLFVTIYAPGVLAARFTCPVVVLTNTSPAGNALKLPALAPVPKTGKGFGAFWQ